MSKTELTIHTANSKHASSFLFICHRKSPVPTQGPELETSELSLSPIPVPHPYSLAASMSPTSLPVTDSRDIIRVPAKVSVLSMSHHSFKTLLSLYSIFTGNPFYIRLWRWNKKRQSLWLRINQFPQILLCLKEQTYEIKIKIPLLHPPDWGFIFVGIEWGLKGSCLPNCKVTLMDSALRNTDENWQSQ